MVKVYFTVDVEIWCGWENLDDRFPSAFRRYVYGPTPSGEYGLPMTLKVLADHGLNAVFFVESLFASRFGVAPLAEIVDLISGSGQEIQLHVHPEWADEAREPILTSHGVKRPLFRMYSAADQSLLIAHARDLLLRSGAKVVTAFRAGSFGMNTDTIGAVANADIAFDLSYDAAIVPAEHFPASAANVVQPHSIGSVIEYPMSVYNDATGRLRHLQLGASSFEEIESVLWHACEHEWHSVVMLSHNFELLNQAKNRADGIVVSRFRRLCQMLERYRDCFETAQFASTPAAVPHCDAALALPRTPFMATGRRYAEQLWRYTYR
jgi:hypothetical protein